VLNYLITTKNHTLNYRRNGNTKLQGYVDADWGGDKDKRRSTSGYIFILAGGAVAWRSVRQQSVALSTMEAEYQAMCEATKEAVYLRSILEFLGFAQLEPTEIHVDNAAAIQLGNNPTDHSRAKHIDLKFHFNREAQDRGIVKFTKITSEQNIADALTKAMPKDRVRKLKTMMGLKEEEESTTVNEGECGETSHSTVVKIGENCSELQK
jgi:hypothetical protein